MATMNISLPEPMKHWAEKQAATGRYANASDYMRDLIRRDQDRQRKIAEMQALVDAGIKCGIGSRSMEELRVHARKMAKDGEDNDVSTQQGS